MSAALNPIGIATDHGGYALKMILLPLLQAEGYDIQDFGAFSLNTTDDYPDFVIPLAQAVASAKISRGIVICGSGVGANIVANKVPGVRAALVHDSFSAHQGVEDDNMNILCLGGRVIGPSLALELVKIFLGAQFSGAPRHQRRLAKVAALEESEAKFETKKELVP